MYGDYRVRESAECPVCGERGATKFYYDLWDDVVGCDLCVTEADADEYLDRLDGENADYEVHAELDARLERKWDD